MIQNLQKIAGNSIELSNETSNFKLNLPGIKHIKQSSIINPILNPRYV